ncbi:MAG: hypothetical protein RL264_142 [Bacteroidota bacterium]|jgi:hypothetical protein
MKDNLLIKTFDFYFNPFKVPKSGVLFLLIILFFITFFQSNVFAQTFNMSNTSQTTCSGTFYDPGGTGDYGNSQTFTMTFTPSTIGAKMRVVFSAFSTESGWDGLMIYDGPDVSSPLISSGSTFNRATCPNGAWSGTTIPTRNGGGGTIISSHCSGALTFRFTSDGSTVSSGWTATFSCLGAETAAAPTNPTACNTNTANMGPGSYQNFPVSTSTDYTFTLQSNPGSGATVSSFNVYNGSSLLGSSSGGTVTVNSGSATSLRVVTCISGSWATGSQTSAVLNYRRRQPGAVTVSGAGTICSGSSATLTASGGANGTMYWQGTSATGTSIGTPGTSQSVSTAGTYYFGSSNGGTSGCWTYNSGATVTVRGAFNGGTLSSTAQTICNNTSPSNISYSTAPSGGSSLQYQWYWQNGSVAAPSGAFSIGSWTAVGSQTASSTLTGATIGNITQTRTYACRVIDVGSPACFDNWAGNAHVVTVRDAFAGGTLTSTAQTICNGSTPSNITYSTAPSGGSSLQYQWYWQNGSIAAPSGAFSIGSWTAIGTQSASSTLSGITIGGITQTRTFACRVIDVGSPACIDSWAGNAHVVTVRDAFSGGTLSSTSQNICFNSTPANISYSSSPSGGSSLQYQWYWQNGTIAAPSGSFSLGSWTAIGTQSASSTLSGATIGNITQTRTYACRVIDVGSPSCFDRWAGNVHIVNVFNDFSGGTLASSSQTICNNTSPSNITYSSSPSGGTSLTYQWYWQAGTISAPTGNFSIGSWTAVGSTTASPTLTGATIGNLTATTTFACRVISGSTCFDRWAGNAHVVTVQSVPTAGSIGSNQTICNGATPSGLTSTGAGSGDGTISYRWESSTTSSSTGFTTIGGATTDSYSPGALTTTTWYRRYTVSTLSSTACESVASNVIQVTVQSTVGAGSIGTAQTICYNTIPSGLTSVSNGTGDGVSGYVWEVSTTSASSGFSTIGGETASTYSPGALTQDTWYRRSTVSTVNGVNCTSATTSAIKITVQTIPTSGTIGSDHTICYNTQPSTLTSSSDGTGIGGSTIAYTWERSTTSSSSGFSSIGGATASTLTGVQAGNLTQTTWFRRTTTATLNGTTCSSAATSAIQVTVQSVPTAGTIGTDHTICYNTSANTLTSSSDGTGDGTIAYRWEKSTTGSGSGYSANAGTSSTLSPGTLTQTTWYRRYTQSTLSGNTCESVATTPVQVTVHNDISTGTIAVDQTICNGSTPVALTNSGSATGSGTISYQWQSSTTSSSSGFSNISGETSSTYAPGSLTTTTWYRRLGVTTLNAVSCTSSSGPVVQITVQGVVSAGSIGSNQTICYNTVPSGLTNSASGSEATSLGTIAYIWESSTTSSSSGFSAIGGQTASTYSPAALTTTTWYRRITNSTLNSTSCTSSPTSSIEITVRPNFTAGSISTTGETLCSNIDPVSISNATVASGGDNSITYEWRANGSPLSSSNSSSYDPSPLATTTTFTRWAKDATCNTTFEQSTGSWVVTVNNPTVTSSLSNGDYVWTGTSNTSWTTTSNWLQYDSGTSSYAAASGYPNSSSVNVILPGVGGCVLNSAVTGGSALSVNNLTIESGHTFNLDNSAATLTIAGNLINNGTWSTPTAGSTVVFNGSGAQTIPAVSYSNLQTANGGTKTLGGSISIPGVVTVGTSTTLALSSNNLVLTSTGTPLVLSGTLNSGTGTVDYAASATQNIAAATYYKLKTSGSSNKSLLGTTTVSNELILDEGTVVVGSNTFNINASTITKNNGNINASNAGATLVFGNSSALTLPNAVFSGVVNNMTLNGSKVKATSDFTLNGTINLNNSNPNDVDGLLDLVQSYGSYGDVQSANSTDGNNNLNSAVLTLGASSSVTGTGDITGKVRRTSFSSGLSYAFNNANMQLTFTGGSLPTQITVVQTKGSEGLHVDKNGSHSTGPEGLIGGAAVKRMWQILRTGGSDATVSKVRLPYLDSELNGNSEGGLVTWVHEIPYAGMSPSEHGKSDINTSSNWVELNNFTLGYLASEGSTSKTKYWMLSGRQASDTLWLGSLGSSWSNVENWSCGTTPTSTTKVVVNPLVYNNALTISGSQSIGAIEIKTNGVVNGGSGTTLTLNRGANAWVNNGTFNPETSTVVFAGTPSTISGNNNFYNLRINTGKTLTVQASSVDTILNNLQIMGTGVLNATSNANTFVFAGDGQTIPISGNGYYNLVIAQQNDNTAVAGGDLTTYGNLSINAGSIDLDGNMLEIKGNFTNNGQLYNAPMVYFTGSGTKHIDGTSVTTFINANVQDGTVNLHFDQDANFEGSLFVDEGSTVYGESSTLEFRNYGTPFTNLGTFNAGTSKVIYNGMDVTDIAVVDYHDLSLTGGSTMNVNGDVVVDGQLIIENVAVEIGSNKLTVHDINRVDNNAFINASSGEIAFINDAPLSLAGDLFTTSTVNNLTDNGTSSVTLGGDLSITGTLALEDGVILMDGHKLTMEDGSTWFRTNGWLNPETTGSILFKSATLDPTVMPSAVVPNLEIERSAGVTITGNLEITGDFKMTEGEIDLGSNTLKLSGNMIYVSGGIDAHNGTIDFNNSANWPLPATFFTNGGLVKNMILSDAGGIQLNQPVKISDALTMNGGDITTDDANILEVGTSATSVGAINWTSGTVAGPMKRWFAASTNSGAASGIFPVGTATINRSAQVNFTQAPTAGGYIRVKFMEGTPPDAYSNFPITYYENGNTNLRKYIQNSDQVGYWEMTPYSADGTEYGALDNSQYTLRLRINVPTSVAEGGHILNNPPGIRLIRAKGLAGGGHEPWSLAGTYSTFVYNSSSDVVIESVQVTGFSWFNGGGNNDNPLPVSLLSFSGECQDGSHILTWKTASEHNSERFEVQVSRDGEVWNTVNSQPAAGVSNSLITYNFVNENGSDAAYYRLRQLDNNGDETMYDPIYVSCSMEENVLISFPNPSDNGFKLMLNDERFIGQSTIVLTDARGVIVNKQTVDIKEGMNLLMMNTELPTGIYYIQLSNGRELSKVLKHSIR